MENLILSLFLYATSIFKEQVYKEEKLVSWNKYNQTPYHYIGTIETPKGKIRLITPKPEEI